MTSGRFPSAAAPTGGASGLLSKYPLVSPAPPQRAAFTAPACGFPVDSRRQQPSIALSHIPPLPIPHRLEYPLGSRLYLGVVHPLPEARGRWFSRSPSSRSRVNLRVLQPLSRGPQGQPSPLRTPRGCPGVQGIFSTSRSQLPRGWSTVPHSVATGLPVPRVCCLVFAVLFLLSLCFRRPAISFFPLRHLATGPVPISFPHPVFIPHRAASNPMARAHWIAIHPGTVSCVLHGSLLSRPLCLGGLIPTGHFGTLLPGPAPVSHPITRAYTPSGRLHPMSTLNPAACCPVALACDFISCLVRRLLLSVLPLPVRSVLCVLWRCLTFLSGVCSFSAHPVGRLPHPFPSACPVLWFPVFPVFSFFFLPSSLHARTSSLDTSSGYCSNLCSSLVLSPTRGLPLGDPRPCQVGALGKHIVTKCGLWLLHIYIHSLGWETHLPFVDFVVRGNGQCLC